MSSVVNYIRKKMTKASKKNKSNQKDQMLTSQAEKIAELTADLSQAQQAKTDLLRVQDSQNKEISELKTSLATVEQVSLRHLFNMISLRTESDQLQVDKVALEDRIRHLEQEAARERESPFQEAVKNLQDRLDKVCQDKWKREQYTHQMEHSLSNCHNTIHQLRQQRNTDLQTIRKLKVQVTDLKTSIQNTPKPKQISMPTCQICLYEFSETHRIPRMLTCGHTLCEECILQIREGPYLRCPFDRKEQCIGPGGVAGLPKNFAIVEVMEGKKKENVPTGKMCSEPVKGGKRRKAFVAENHF